MPTPRIRIGTVIGREHVRLGKNNQDAKLIRAIMLGGKHYHFGALSDGCSGGENSEVGSRQIVQYLCSEIRMMLTMGMAIEQIPEPLFSRSIGYLRSVASLSCVGDQDEYLQYIKDHLLATVLGFIMNNEKIIIFSAGDGVIIINDEVVRIDQNNTPMYLAYHLVERQYLKLQGGELPERFAIRTLDGSKTEKFALCSDGITEGAISQIWGHDNPLGLQRRLKILSRGDEPFTDDCTVITVENLFDQPSPQATAEMAMIGDES